MIAANHSTGAGPRVEAHPITIPQLQLNPATVDETRGEVAVELDGKHLVRQRARIGAFAEVSVAAQLVGPCVGLDDHKLVDLGNGQIQFTALDLQACGLQRYWATLSRGSPAWRSPAPF